MKLPLFWCILDKLDLVLLDRPDLVPALGCTSTQHFSFDFASDRQ